MFYNYPYPYTYPSSYQPSPYGYDPYGAYPGYGQYPGYDPYAGYYGYPYPPQQPQPQPQPSRAPIGGWDGQRRIVDQRGKKDGRWEKQGNRWVWVSQ